MIYAFPEGIATANLLTNHYPTKLVTLCMSLDDREVIAMIKSGCVAYLFKDVPPGQLELALKKVVTKV